ncbi:MAG: hypothetical protein LBT46_09600 [Planctomycetaceae bacterium]|jgi:hypothetical protein|nr:hypothetical protein [Planctomycetaceae bacterium]
MQKSLDVKIKRIFADQNCRDFILADAKDADMAFGLAAPGKNAGETSYRTLDQYREQIRLIIEQGLVDIVLMSASTSEILTVEEHRFDNSPITPAIRANDTTDIWLAGAEGVYGQEPSRCFRTATLDDTRLRNDISCRRNGTDLGLYSITFNNIVEYDREALTAYKEFRQEAELKGFRHFLEVFSPNIAGLNCPKDIPAFVNNHIVRTLAGVTSKERPVFLKIPYYGPAAMEALARYDSRLIVGILGGSEGTAFDAFQMLADAKKYGARVALYGRKINHSEHQLTFIKYLRLVADDDIYPQEAVYAYHSELTKLRIKPHRTLDDDLCRSEFKSNY